MKNAAIKFGTTPINDKIIENLANIDCLINEITVINSLANKPQTSYNINDIMKRYIA